MRKLGTLVVCLSSAIFMSSTSFAAKFANQFVEFELPPQWQCNLEGAEWVCQSTNESKKKEAIIVLAAKLKGDQDSLDQYLTYLKSAKSYKSIQGKPVKSEPRYAKTANLNGHPWVDSLHLESEIPGFYTRYLATVKQDIGVLVTYSINKTKYQAYLKDFDNMVNTLKVFRKTGGINVAPAGGGSIVQNVQIPQSISEGTIFPGANPMGGSESPATPAPTQEKSPATLLLILAAGVILILIFIKKRRGGD